MLEIYIMVSDICDNMDLVLVVKDFSELEAELSIWEVKLKSLNMSIPMFPINKEMVNPMKRRFLRVEAPFVDEISELGIIKLL